MTRWNHWANSPFVGTFVYTFTFPQMPVNDSVYSPVQGYVYVPYATGLMVVDPTGATPGVITTVPAGMNVESLVYLPLSNKVLVHEVDAQSHKLYDCATGVLSSSIPWLLGGVGQPANYGHAGIICSRYGVNPLTDLVYVGSRYQVGWVDPISGSANHSGFGDGFLFSMNFVVAVCFNPADGYLYCSTTGDGTEVIDPSGWTRVHNFAGLAGQRLWRNPITGKVWTGNLSTSFYELDASTFVAHAATTYAYAGDYDPEYGTVNTDITPTHPTARLFDLADTFVVNAAANPVLTAAMGDISAAYNQGRFVLSKASTITGDVFSTL